MNAEPSVEYPRFEKTGHSQAVVPSSGGATWAKRSDVWRCAVGLPLLVTLCGTAIVGLHGKLDRQQRSRDMAVNELRVLPRGDILKPALLGYTQVGADLLWLRIVQVMGADVVRPDDGEWLYHALDVVTTLDPQFLVAYDLGGGLLSELSGKVAWSNALLEKGRAANPDAWRLPFLLGFNHFFHLHDYVNAAGYMAEAARLSGAPAYVPELAARLYVEAQRPESALSFLDTMLAQADHPQLYEALVRRRKAVVLERDLDRLEQAREAYARSTGHALGSLQELVRGGWFDAIPPEPFDGAYVLDHRTGHIASTTHPERMRLYRPADAQAIVHASVQP